MKANFLRDHFDKYFSGKTTPLEGVANFLSDGMSLEDLAILALFMENVRLMSTATLAVPPSMDSVTSLRTMFTALSDHTVHEAVQEAVAKQVCGNIPTRPVPDMIEVMATLSDIMEDIAAHDEKREEYECAVAEAPEAEGDDKDIYAVIFATDNEGYALPQMSGLALKHNAHTMSAIHDMRNELRSDLGDEPVQAMQCLLAYPAKDMVEQRVVMPNRTSVTTHTWTFEQVGLPKDMSPRDMLIALTYFCATKYSK